ncbi:MAG: MFS transporter [Alphaproteobacteria bacterium]|nr:MFS transporter [Alphaproteobacteria bacterium]
MERQVCRKIAFRLLPFLVICYFLSFLDRVNVSYAELTMSVDLGFSASVYGWGAGIFFVGYALFEVPSNILLHRFGARRWIARIMISWGIISACLSLVDSAFSFYALRFLLGFAEAGFFPGIIYYLSRWFPAAWRARIVGSFMIALPLSSVLGAPVSSVILGVDHFGLAGWQWLFILEGVPTVLMGVVVLLVLPDGPGDASWLKSDERQWLQETLATEEAAADHGSIEEALFSGRVWALCFVYLAIVVGLYGFTFWIPQITKGLGGLSNAEAILITVLPNALAAAVLVIWGRRSDDSGERVGHLAWPALLGGALFAAAGATSDRPLVSYVLLCSGFLASFAAFPVFWTLPMAILGGSGAAAGIALINSIGNLGGFLGPVIIGEVKDLTGSYGAGLAVVGGFVAMAGVLTLALARITSSWKSEIRAGQA